MYNIYEKLAEESGITQYVAANNKYLERFAEMIIKECIGQCEGYGSTDEWDSGVRYAANQIREHFGVKQ